LFETDAELAGLQQLLDASHQQVEERMSAIYSPEQRLSAQQLAGFSGVRLVSIASLNRKGEPRVGPRSAALLHGKFYLAANRDSVTVRRLFVNPMAAITYYENHLLLMGHGTVGFIPVGESEFARVSPEWKRAFRGGRDALLGTDVFLRFDATHLIAFAQRPERYPVAWKKRPY